MTIESCLREMRSPNQLTVRPLSLTYFQAVHSFGMLREFSAIQVVTRNAVEHESVVASCVKLPVDAKIESRRTR
jgi:hypothetical protein